ncbi:MAG: hypothetical protein ACLVJB_04630 [Christensenellales bacterium]
MGGYAAEALVRNGIGAIDLYDDDRVCLTNLMPAHRHAKTVSQYKVDAMGAGNKLDPSRLRVAHIEKTSVCPLARVMRTELRKRKIRKLKVVFSDEQPVKPDDDPALSCRNHCICPPGTVRKCTARRDIPGSTAFVPPAMGIMIASEIVRDLIAASSRQA